ncbi:MAG: SCP-like extracellular [Novosphingobium sp.]|nr:SCP-like extracellular [Novosphingobium sp.]
MLRLVLRRSLWCPAALLAACSLASPALGQDRLGRFDDRILATHNAERARLGIGPLAWSPTLAAQAQQWAAHLSTLPALEHDNSLEIEGENLWRGSKGAYTPEDMVTLWIDEQVAFRNGVFPDVSKSGQWEDVGHYTQVIWRTTATVGCALTTAGGEDEVLVCRYNEGGNIEGEKTF